MVLALSATASTLGLVFVFFVIFPVLVQGLVTVAVAGALGERAENAAYADHMSGSGDDDEVV